MLQKEKKYSMEVGDRIVTFLVFKEDKEWKSSLSDVGIDGKTGI